MIEADGYRNLSCVMLGVTIITVLGLLAWSSASAGQGPSKAITVIVDPGHGGQDAGGKGPGGIIEKALTLALANKLAEVLEETRTIRSVLTRTDDYTISLDDRAGLANHRGGDLLISLHLGSSFQSAPTGFSLYYWSPVTATPRVSSPSSQKPLWDQEQRSFWENSRVLAMLIQQELLATLSWPSGGVLQADLYLLRRVRMPAVLVELGSLNHSAEAAELQEPEFQEAVARAVAEAINKFRKEQVKVERKR